MFFSIWPIMKVYIICYISAQFPYLGKIRFPRYGPKCSSQSDWKIFKSTTSVCNFLSMKLPVDLNSLLSKFFCYITCLLYQLIRRDTGRLANEAFTLNPIVSSKQKLNGLKITNCIKERPQFFFLHTLKIAF